MRTQLRGLAGVLGLLLGLVLAPVAVQAQEYNGGYEVPPPDVVFPWPFGHPRYEDGGLYVGGEFLFVKQTNPLKSQLLAFRGLNDSDGNIGRSLGLNTQPGDFIGSRLPALDVTDASGPNNYTPGYSFTIGWRFQSGLTVEFNWKHLVDMRQSAVATQAPGGPPGIFLQDTFLTSPVYNFPPNFDGPADVVGNGGNNIARGIWNASTTQQVTFLQRFDQFEIVGRFPIQQTDGWRTYGTIGPRAVAMWERFTWRVVNTNTVGDAGSDDVAIYSNVTSNRLYGVNCGIGNEWYLGTTPLGAFSFSADLHAGLYADFVKGRPKYELGDFSISSSRARSLFTLAPGLEGNFNLHWFPYEAIQFRMGYDISAYFNTVASPRPVDFNYGAVSPAYETGITRLFSGFNFGMAFVF